MMLTIKYSLWQCCSQGGSDLQIWIGVKKKKATNKTNKNPQRNPCKNMSLFLSGKQVAKQAPADTFTTDFCSLRLPVNRCAWFLLLQTGQGSGHTTLVAWYNSHQNPFKVGYVSQKKIVLISR